jgi:hypothetical protein
LKLQHELAEQLHEHKRAFPDRLTDEEDQRERLQLNPKVSNPLNS